jgi:hypothetical protein
MRNDHGELFFTDADRPPIGTAQQGQTLMTHRSGFGEQAHGSECGVPGR